MADDSRDHVRFLIREIWQRRLSATANITNIGLPHHFILSCYNTASIMPPTTMLAPVKAALCPQSSIASLLKPFAQIQLRSASILSELSDVPSSYNRRLRLGRGPSSGKGKTSGRGQKGQKARGKVPKQFNGGQTPEGVTHGKEGFTNV